MNETVFFICTLVFLVVLVTVIVINIPDEREVYSGKEGKCYLKDGIVTCYDNENQIQCKYTLGRDSGHWC